MFFIAQDRMLKIVTEMRSGAGSGLSPFGQNAASTIRDSREREKKEMSDLNDRLASYIEKVWWNQGEPHPIVFCLGPFPRGPE